MNEGLLSSKNALGRQVSLLNQINDYQLNLSTVQDSVDNQQQKRKYHCIEPGCNKSFTTSGHLARHYRIHTGEKNFSCLYPGCQSKFSRQDNMMQHYRTHTSPKSRKSQKRSLSDQSSPRQRQRTNHMKSDSVSMTTKTTKDPIYPSVHKSSIHPSHAELSNELKVQSIPALFYQHRPLTFTRLDNIDLPYTLLHPTLLVRDIGLDTTHHPSNENNHHHLNEKDNNNNNNNNNGTSSSSLLQLGHIISSFG
ncbi:hypothetical protein BDB01DRAFT_716930 [Pilobolus umbonatus]|nr:hypothetical protein BDB01DRAFT_716930 [Pilobolus umbonatus]